ncbi:hypothetical protein RradSPS_2647 [Rubrobacter radiotolerans]|uniref:SAM-dependent methyltransferase n=1 Tax=Rubrobacter radiotolerans TaxID=42256 RepID=A0A023X7B2_RUBRA|nr:SAM-dependent methyltransferase [Rubrobacter radiotolerans]AHY47930.1 hypothetical protein RradSPS_2647 [Rubrobacter radiotolerans]MDX5892569.1 SAM-dependent methyltransferase [Rubrobacter radiotolerans]SMC07858.1 tRNA-Thr(GGU) m(6)t(6)A37 methyltransferase TsaA [Rubrobacter radiotolerans DSM 5868]
MRIELYPIGYVRTAPGKVPRSWRTSELEGEVVLDGAYAEGLANVEAGQRLLVVFNFHESEPFSEDLLTQTPRSADGEPRGVFSTLSPRRPNPLGVSIVTVLAREGTTLRVRGLDMRDGTPVLDLKPWRGDVAGSPVFPDR